MKQVRRGVALVLGVVLVAGLALAEPSSGGGGPFTPCSKCRVVSGSSADLGLKP